MVQRAGDCERSPWFLVVPNTGLSVFVDFICRSGDRSNALLAIWERPEKTIKVQRSCVMAKLRARTVADLVPMLAKVGLAGLRLARTPLLAQQPTRRCQCDHSFFLDGRPLAIDRHCGRRPVGAEGFGTPFARTLFRRKDLPVGPRVSRGTARELARVPDCRLANAEHERVGASSRLATCGNSRACHHHFCARGYKRAPALQIRWCDSVSCKAPARQRTASCDQSGKIRVEAPGLSRQRSPGFARLRTRQTARSYDVPGHQSRGDPLTVGLTVGPHGATPRVRLMRVAFHNWPNGDDCQ